MAVFRQAGACGAPAAGPASWAFPAGTDFPATADSRVRLHARSRENARTTAAAPSASKENRFDRLWFGSGSACR